MTIAETYTYYVNIANFNRIPVKFLTNEVLLGKGGQLAKIRRHILAKLGQNRTGVGGYSAGVVFLERNVCSPSRKFEALM